MKRREFVMCIAAAAGAGWRAGAAAKPLLGLTVNFPEGGSEKDVGKGLVLARDLGVRACTVGYMWKDVELKPGVYNLEGLDKALRGFGAFGFRVCVTLRTLDTNNRVLSADLQDKPFDSEAMRERFDSLVEAIAPRLTDHVACILLANEPDIYLAKHADELEAFAGLAERGRQRLRTLRPGLPVGVATTFNGLRDRPRLAERLNRSMDILALTYYPLAQKMMVRPVSEVAGDFEKMAEAAGGKQLLLKEIGYPADPRLGSSEDQQAAFVDAVFDAVEKHAAKISIFNFFVLYDFESRLVDMMTRYYGVSDGNFRAYLSTLGLKRADGTPRQAWARFEARARALLNSQ
jgi:hypothetical protein